MMIEKKVQESSAFIRNLVSATPAAAVILGSGLGELTKSMEITTRLSYKDIPHFPVSTVAGHQGEMVFGKLNGTEICVLNGRKHYYEGVPMAETVFPVYVLKELGIRTLILSNAAGGLNPSFQVGDLMLMTDHISFFFDTPLQKTAGVEPQMAFSELYSRRLASLAKRKAAELHIPLQHGTYLAHSGPYYGTAAESRMQARMGGDAVGMSTIPEAIAARSLQMEILSFSVITDLAYDGVDEHPTHEKVLEAAQKAGISLVKLVRELAPEI